MAIAEGIKYLIVYLNFLANNWIKPKNVKIDQTEIKNMKTTYNTTIDEWKVKIGNKDKKIKELEKKVTDLETEVKNLQNR